MNLTDDERHLLLAGLFVLSITQTAENDDERAAITSLVRKLGSGSDVLQKPVRTARERSRAAARRRRIGHDRVSG